MGLPQALKVPEGQCGKPTLFLEPDVVSCASVARLRGRNLRATNAVARGSTDIGCPIDVERGPGEMAHAAFR